MPGRTRPIEKFAEAVAKCSTEVNNIRASNGGFMLTDVRLLYTGNASLQISMEYTRTNVLRSS